MNIDLDYLEKEGVFQADLQKNLYSVKLQKKSIEDKIH
jgi:hypothetical protein